MGQTLAAVICLHFIPWPENARVHHKTVKLGTKQQLSTRYNACT